jgi:hypothetical protein
MGYIQGIAVDQEGRACEAGQSAIAESYMDETSNELDDIQKDNAEVL